ncbi:MAG: outer membrane beta-barrel protein [Luteibaculum sp.]
MKKALTLLALLFAGLTSQAQQDQIPGPVDTTTIKLGDKSTLMYIRNKEPYQEEAYFSETADGDILIGKREKGRKKRVSFWTGLDMGFNVLVDENQSTNITADTKWNNQPGKSMYWGINLAKAEGRLFGNHYIMTGLGLNYRSITPNDFYSINVTRDTTHFLDSSNYLNPMKSKLRATYIQVPLLINFNTSRDYKRNFHIAFGVLGNLRIGSTFKEKHKLNGDTQKEKTRDDFNLRPIIADATLRIGFSSFTVFFNYGLTPLFEDGAAPELYPLTFGVQLLGF